MRSRSVMVKNWCNVISMEGVTVCGHHPECRVTFGRGGPHIVWWDPRTDHRTSLETISNVPCHIPVKFKVCVLVDIFVDRWDQKLKTLYNVLMFRPNSPELALFPDLLWVSNIPRYFYLVYGTSRTCILWSLLSSVFLVADEVKSIYAGHSEGRRIFLWADRPNSRILAICQVIEIWIETSTKMYTPF